MPLRPFLVAAFLVILAAPAAAAPQEGPEARLRRLEDREAIARVLTEYGRLLDARDFKGYAALFARDGEWIGGFGSAKGPAAIQAMMEQSIRPSSAGSRPSSYHLLSNYQIDVDGDRARAWSRWSFVVNGADGRGSIMYAGRYEDELVREDGQWRFLRRRAVSDVPPEPPGPPAQ